MAKKPYRVVKGRMKDGTEKVYCYHTVTGKALPPPGSPGFEEALVRGAMTDTPLLVNGTVRQLVDAYRAQPEYASIRPATRRIYERSFKLIERKIGHRAADSIVRSDIRDLRNEISRTPAGANQLLGTMKVIFRFAYREDLIPKPIDMTGLKMKVGKWGTWQPQDIEKFLAAEHPQFVLLAFLVALYTGQRLTDVMTMTWGQVDLDQGLIRLTQSKTRKSLWLPMHGALRDSLREAKKGTSSIYIVNGVGGQPIKPELFSGHYFQDAKERAGLGKGLPFHGLRKTAGIMLAEAGATPFEIMAVLGQATLEMVALYTAEADQKQNAQAAIAKVENSTGRFSSVRRAVESIIKKMASSRAAV
jgi:integrase